ncbi:hypothetical protein OIU76_023432 [Salix suchowensis]|nr:hypothetical protein OIU76_023432 [Salix suchowensis]
MSSASEAWLVAASVGSMEALKDQGFCRWNYALRKIVCDCISSLISVHGRVVITPVLYYDKICLVSWKIPLAFAAGFLPQNHHEEGFSLRFFSYTFGKMSSASKAWLVAAAIGGVEALKDQGFCRWNYTLRSLHQHAKNHVRSASQAKMLSSSSSAMISNKVREVKAKQSEESLRKVMYLSCWGPY